MKLGSRKYRPTIRVILALMLLIAVATPLAGLFFFRVIENQLIRKTEAELIAQTAVLAAVMRAETSELPLSRLGPEVEDRPGALTDFSPAGASLDLATDPILPPRPEPLAVEEADYPWLKIGEFLDPLIEDTRWRTLAGIQALDPEGRVLTGAEAGGSLAFVPEVAEALKGQLSQQLRTRSRRRPPPILYELTKGASVRIFVAFPVIDRGRIAGVIYASRTPQHILQVAWQERRSLALAGLATLIAISAFGFVATRALTRPIQALTVRTRRIDAGEREALQPLRYHGTKEVAELSDIFLRTAQHLYDRSESLSAFAAHVAHELKSPLTAIQGAAELIREAEADMSPETRKTFLSNIVSDAERMTLLVRRLLDLARAEAANNDGPGCADVAEVVKTIRAPVEITLTGTAKVAMREDKLEAVLGDLADNAARHGAKNISCIVTTEKGRVTIRVADDGVGISAGNRNKVFDPFFTTRRDQGGTGMGLSIVRALLEAHNGTVTLAESDKGATFDVELPLALSGDGGKG